MTNDTDRFLQAVRLEVARARTLFPKSDGLLAALSEEAGEVAKAMLDEPMDRVWKEAVQVAAMALRLATEGDPTLSAIREARVKEGKNLPTYGK